MDGKGFGVCFHDSGSAQTAWWERGETSGGRHSINWSRWVAVRVLLAVVTAYLPPPQCLPEQCLWLWSSGQPCGSCDTPSPSLVHTLSEPRWRSQRSAPRCNMKRRASHPKGRVKLMSYTNWDQSSINQSSLIGSCVLRSARKSQQNKTVVSETLPSTYVNKKMPKLWRVIHLEKLSEPLTQINQEDVFSWAPWSVDVLTWHTSAPVMKVLSHNYMLFGHTDVSTWCRLKQSAQMWDAWIHLPCNSRWRGSNILTAWSC